MQSGTMIAVPAEPDEDIATAWAACVTPCPSNVAGSNPAATRKQAVAASEELVAPLVNS